MLSANIFKPICLSLGHMVDPNQQKVAVENGSENMNNLNGIFIARLRLHVEGQV